MSSTTEQRMALETAVITCLNAGDTPDEVMDAVSEFIESLTLEATPADDENGDEGEEKEDEESSEEEAEVPSEPETAEARV